MKRIAFLAAAAALIAAPAFAQQGFDSKAKPGAMPMGGSGAAMSPGSGAAQPAMATGAMKRTAKKSKAKKKSRM